MTGPLRRNLEEVMCFKVSVPKPLLSSTMLSVSSVAKKVITRIIALIAMCLVIEGELNVLRDLGINA